MKLHIKVAFFIACLTLPLLGFGLYQNAKTFYTMSRGNYFFAHSRNNLQLKTIVIDFGNDNKITIEENNGLWRVKEADDYFASFAQTGSLLKFISDTVVYRADKLNENDIKEHLEKTIKIICKDTKGNVLESAAFAPKKDNNRYQYALLNDNSFLYQLKGNFAPSSVLMDWVQMPLLNIYEDSIKRIETNTFAVYRHFSDERLKSVENNELALYIGQLINNFRYLNAEDIKHITHFNPALFKKVKRYDITLFNGMIYDLEVYNKDNEYWLRIRLNHELTAPLATKRQIKERQILYDGWFFKINKDKGYVISSFSL